jgi:hypothetical protein
VLSNSIVALPILSPELFWNIDTSFDELFENKTLINCITLAGHPRIGIQNPIKAAMTDKKVGA